MDAPKQDSSYFWERAGVELEKLSQQAQPGDRYQRVQVGEVGEELQVGVLWCNRR